MTCLFSFFFHTCTIDALPTELEKRVKVEPELRVTRTFASARFSRLAIIFQRPTAPRAHSSTLIYVSHGLLQRPWKLVLPSSHLMLVRARISRTWSVVACYRSISCRSFSRAFYLTNNFSRQLLIDLINKRLFYSFLRSHGRCIFHMSEPNCS